MLYNVNYKGGDIIFNKVKWIIFNKVKWILFKFRVKNIFKLKYNFWERFENFYKNDTHGIENFEKKLKLELKSKEIEMNHLSTLGFGSVLLTVLFKDYIKEFFDYLDYTSLSSTEAEKIYGEAIQYFTKKDAVGIVGICLIFALLGYIIIIKGNDFFAKRCLYIIEEVDKDENEKIQQLQEEKDKQLKISKEEYEINIEILNKEIVNNKILTEELINSKDKFNIIIKKMMKRYARKR